MNLKKMERYLQVNLLGPGPRLMKKRIYWAVVSQRLRNTGLDWSADFQSLAAHALGNIGQPSVGIICFPAARLKDLTFILLKQVFQFWHIVMKNTSVILTAKDKIMKQTASSGK